MRFVFLDDESYFELAILLVLLLLLLLSSSSSFVAVYDAYILSLFACTLISLFKFEINLS